MKPLKFEILDPNRRYRNLGAWLREIQNRRRLTADDLAHLIDRSRPHLQEMFKRGLSYTMAQEFAAKLNEPLPTLRALVMHTLNQEIEALPLYPDKASIGEPV